jgi:hypothetical protein
MAKDKKSNMFADLGKDAKVCLKLNRNGEVAVTLPDDAPEGTTTWTPDLALAKAQSLGKPLHKYSFYVQQGLTFKDVGQPGVEVTARLYWGKPQIVVHKPVQKVVNMTTWIS